MWWLRGVGGEQLGASGLVQQQQSENPHSGCGEED